MIDSCAGSNGALVGVKGVKQQLLQKASWNLDRLDQQDPDGIYRWEHSYLKALTGTLERTRAALELSPMILGLVQSLPGSPVILLLDLQVTQGNP